MSTSERTDSTVRFLLAVWSGYLDVRGGAVARSGYPLLLEEDWDPEPDVVVVQDRHRSRMLPHGLDGPADVVIDVASSRDGRGDRVDRIPGYRKASVTEVWMIEPEKQRIRVERRADRLNYQQEIVTWGKLQSAVVEGFWIESEWLWRDQLPAVEECVDQILGR